MKTILATTLALGLGFAAATSAVARDGDVRRGYDRGDHRGWDSRYDQRRYEGRGHVERRHDGRRYQDRRIDGKHRADGKHWVGYRDSYRHGYRDSYRYGYGYRHDYRYEVDPTWRYDRYHRYRAPSRYVPPRGYYSYRWDVGYRLPSTYYGSSYYVDYRPYRLWEPPYGHRWVRVDNDVFLVALTSGLITYALHDLFH